MRSKGDVIESMNSMRHSEHQSLILKHKDEDDMVWQLDNHGWTPHVIENMQMDMILRAVCQVDYCRLGDQNEYDLKSRLL
jgi:hypothetical protein